MFESLPTAAEMARQTETNGARYQRMLQSKFTQTILEAITDASSMGKRSVDVPYYTDRFSSNFNFLTNESVDEVVEALEDLGYEVAARDVRDSGYFRVKW